MRTLVRNGIILLACILLSVWAIMPPEKKLRKGKDLAGGASLVYGVDVRPGEGDVINKVIEVVKERVDPDGVMDISFVAQGADRIEITMPLPTDRVKRLRAEFDATLAPFASSQLSPDELERVMNKEPAARTAELDRLAAGNAERKDKFAAAAKAFDERKAVRAQFTAESDKIRSLSEQLDLATKAVSSPDDPSLNALKDAVAAEQTALNAIVEVAAPLEIAWETARDAALAGSMSAADVRRVLSQPDRPIRLSGKDGKPVEFPGARTRGIKELRDRYPQQSAQLDTAIAAWNAYEAERRGLDDPQDLIRLLRGAGVLNFRIAVSSQEYFNEAEVRAQFRAGGPRAVRSDEVRFFKINKVDNWVDSVENLEALQTDPSSYFAQRGLVAEAYKGEFYILLWDRPGSRLTENDGEWSLAGASQGSDQLGRPAIDFRMDALGGSKLGSLTEKNVGKQMAVVLDDEIYTAPTLQSRISNSGQISGVFSRAELDYVIRVLSAGSLKAKLSPEPISQSVLGPQLGADNLRQGLQAGIISIVAVGGFIIVYYFGCGLIAVLALALNGLLLVASMSLNSAAFTLPGIAGIILTFGMAVDANVLIYERMREEMKRGHDLRTCVRLGYAKALSAIVDGQLTTLIAAVVLGIMGTPEIRGFAITLGIGTVTTLFAQLFGTRFIFAVLVEYVKIRKMSMLPLTFPIIDRAWQRSIDWMGLRGFSYFLTIGLVLMGLGFVVFEGKNLLGNEFRGGTMVTLQFKNGDDGKPLSMQRKDVQERIETVSKSQGTASPLFEMRNAEVIAVNPDADNVTSSTFTVKTLITDAALVQSVLTETFKDKIDSRPALKFAGSDARIARDAPLLAITSPILGDIIERPDDRTQITEFSGGVAIILSNITPPTALADIEARLTTLRQAADFAETLQRKVLVKPLAGSDAAVSQAVVLVADPEISFFSDQDRWERELRDREWALVKNALTTSQTLAGVQSFSPSVAANFQAQAIVAVLLATVLITIYVWVRFNSFRYSLAAILTTLHDCVVAVGLVALASYIYRNHPQLAASLGLLPFKIDLNVVAAVLTILGYSLNDTVVVMDRIRENRGKLPYASRKVINDAINQTLSRTVITGFTVGVSCLVLYVVGGEGVRVFAYTMLIGVIVGTYSSVAVAAPLVWKKEHDPHANEPAGAPAPLPA
jgi:SecD/SecF fusion protein